MWNGYSGCRGACRSGVGLGVSVTGCQCRVAFGWVGCHHPGCQHLPTTHHRTTSCHPPPITQPHYFCQSASSHNPATWQQSATHRHHRPTNSCHRAPTNHRPPTTSLRSATTLWPLPLHHQCTWHGTAPHRRHHLPVAATYAPPPPTGHHPTPAIAKQCNTTGAVSTAHPPATAPHLPPRPASSQRLPTTTKTLAQHCGDNPPNSRK